MWGRNRQVTFILFSEKTKFRVSRASSSLLALVSHDGGRLLLELRMFQLPVGTVLLPSLLRLLVYLGLCNKEEDTKPRICELSKLAVSGAEGGAVALIFNNWHPQIWPQGAEKQLRKGWWVVCGQMTIQLFLSHEHVNCFMFHLHLTDTTLLEEGQLIF